MTDLNELADELEGLTKQDRFSIVDLGVCAYDNLPTLLSALRDAGKMREALEEIDAIPLEVDGGDWDEINKAHRIARAALKTEGE